MSPLVANNLNAKKNIFLLYAHRTRTYILVAEILSSTVKLTRMNQSNTILILYM
jgi:hypothetical protein